MHTRYSFGEIQRRGLMMVLSSPSGAGKTTISRRLLEEDSDIMLSVSVTTRAPRPKYARAGSGPLLHPTIARPLHSLTLRTRPWGSRRARGPMVTRVVQPAFGGGAAPAGVVGGQTGPGTSRGGMFKVGTVKNGGRQPAGGCGRVRRGRRPHRMCYDAHAAPTPTRPSIPPHDARVGAFTAAAVIFRRWWQVAGG